MGPYYVCCGYDLHLDRSVVDFYIYLRYSGTACVYFSFRWGPLVHSLGIIQWNSTRRDHPGNPGRVSGSGPVSLGWCPKINSSRRYSVDQICCRGKCVSPIG